MAVKGVVQVAVANMVMYVAVSCIVLECVAVSVTVVKIGISIELAVLWEIVRCCSVLMCCSVVLQCGALRCSKWLWPIW